MPELWQTSHRYDSSWPSVVLAFFLRYPSPTTPHIVSVDTISRKIDLQTHRLYTERLILKKGATSALPKWFPTKVLGKTESWVYERSCVDLQNGQCELLTRNLDHRTVMDVWEDLDIRADNNTLDRNRYGTHDFTLFNTSCVVTSSFGFPYIQSRIEQFGLARYKAGTEKSRNSVSVILELLTHSHHRESLLNGNPPPLSAMLAPALSESFTRWEETGSGFAGHGFNDTDKDRYLLHHEENEEPPKMYETGRQWLEWARERRAQAVQSSSDRLKQIRTRWFGWRLRMREIEKEEVIEPQPAVTSDNKSQSSSANSPIAQSNEQTPQPQIRKSRSWVWEWSRNRD